MKGQLENRVKELKSQLESGEKMMEELDTKRTNLGYTILRISGAIQVLEEMIEKSDENNTEKDQNEKNQKQ